MKFVAAVAAATLGLVQAQTAAPTPVPCVPLNLTAKAGDITMLNGVINIAISSGLLKDQLVTLDPLNIVSNRLDPVPFSVLGMDFEVTPIIKSLTATGIATVVPEQLNITSDTSLAIGANFNGTINVDAGLSFEIAQLNKKWWHICWTNVLRPITCPPATVDVILGVGLQKPTVDVDTAIGLNMCPPGLPRGTCTDVTVSNILIAALNDQLPDLWLRIQKKLSSASIKDFQVSVESLTKLKFDFERSNALFTALFEKLLGYTAAEVNKKGKLYNDIIKTVSGLSKTLLNQLLTADLAPTFGNTCY